ncbi:Synaptic vesicle glycoprotein 2B [Temnothorax longispinosus]|uniref:Synaptic vesicle glycoprotein 2B n=1 Tax=Temnothorax longispinosus TaxID=300112 RepID=A0A4S2KN62_9HYME|nr:Synaptic vesicle glycoprotein 2B [Temnothorax longispinosus]
MMPSASPRASWRAVQESQLSALVVNYRRHMVTPYGLGSIKSSVSARAARIEGSHARPADIGWHPLYNPPVCLPTKGRHLAGLMD